MPGPWGVPGPGGVPGPSGVPGLRGVPGPRGVSSQHVLRQTSPPRGQTDRCKNITFATSLRTVKNSNHCDVVFIQNTHASLTHCVNRPVRINYM